MDVHKISLIIAIESVESGWNGMAKARALNFFTKGGYIKSSQRDDKSPLKGAWFCSRHPSLSVQL